MMMRRLKKKFGRKYSQEIDPDVIFLDSSNLPGFDTDQFEGRIEKPITSRTFVVFGMIFILIIFIFTVRVFNVQILEGEVYAQRSQDNRLRETLVFADRGIIYDRNGEVLAWNEDREDEFNTRKYVENSGLSTLLGYVSYPKKDSAGFYYDESINGVKGKVVEYIYEEELAGENGVRLIEIDALNNVKSENVMIQPVAGKNINLTIDYNLQKNLFNSLSSVVDESDFYGGGAVIMDIYSGEIISLASYPEYNPNVLTEGDDLEKISEYRSDSRNPFLNKVISGLYTPGSIIKPFVATGILQEEIMSSTDEVVSRGSLEVPNPYNPDNPSIFNDWKAHGAVNIRGAIANSSNIYFYIAGGGYDDISGLGITKINEYVRKFGFGENIESEIFGGVFGTVPNPEWKREIFDDIWRLGDTYFTAIGQYGFQVTPLQAVRGVSALASGGMLVKPEIVIDPDTAPKVEYIEGIDDWVYDTVKAGMRDTVTYGTSKALQYDDLELAVKTGTAELGVSKSRVNSWLTGFWPYNNPRYAFAIFLEKGHRSNTIGAVTVARRFFDWLRFNSEEYLR